MHSLKPPHTLRALTGMRWSALAMTGLLGVAHAATLTVTDGGDSGPGTLRQTLAEAAAGDTIAFNSSVNTVTLAGQLVLARDVTIDGGSAGVTLDGQLKGRVVLVNAGVAATLKQLTITRGLLAGKGIDWDGTAESGSSWGAGIRNDGALTLDSVQVVGNYATGGGGGSGGPDAGAGGGGSGARVSQASGGWLYGHGGTGGEAGINHQYKGGRGGLNGGGGRDGIRGGGGGGGRDANGGAGAGGGGGWAGGGGAGGYNTSSGASGGGGGGFGGGGGARALDSGGTGPDDNGTGGLGGSPNGGTASAGKPGTYSGGYGGGGGYAVLDGVWVGGGGGSGGSNGQGAGAAVGGIYNAAGATLAVQGADCKISANLAAGGGGSGYRGGGAATGGLWNAGTLGISSTCKATLTGNAADGGRGGNDGAAAATNNDLYDQYSQETNKALTVTLTGAGSISAISPPTPKAGGINACKATTCQAFYALNAEVTLNATPNTGHHITWGGACTAHPTNPLQATVTLADHASCTATFAIDTYPLTIATPANGSIACTVSDAPVSSGTVLDYGTQVSCTAPPSSTSYQHSGWTGACSTTAAGSSCTITMDATKTVGASFAKIGGSTDIPDVGMVDIALSSDSCTLASGPTHTPAPTSGAPAGYTFPMGQIAFSATGCAPGSTLPLTLTLPTALPTDAKLYKLLDGKWVEWMQSSINGTTVQLTVTDDDGTSTATDTGDNNPTEGIIDDPILLAVPASVAPTATPVPTLSQWALTLLSALMVTMGWLHARNRRMA